MNAIQNPIIILCANCNTELSGPFCSNCGQKHHPHKESFKELLLEFFSDFTHFDSRFFSSIIPLIIKPGVLTKRYNEGKRASQLNPIRLYLFSSFLYFLFLFNSTNTDLNLKNISTNLPQADSLDKKELAEAQKNINNKIDNKDSLNKSIIFGSARLDSLLANRVTSEEYIHQQNALPANQRDNFVKKYFYKKTLKLYHEGIKDSNELLSRIFTHAFHNIPKMLFFLLPLFALILKILYLRNKKFYYADHAIFSIHFFSFVFLLLLLSQYILNPIFNTHLFGTFAIIWILAYLLIAMKKIYGQSKLHTFAKYLTLGFTFSMVLLIAFIINFIISAAAA